MTAPAGFQQAQWRGTTSVGPHEPGEKSIGVSFDLVSTDLPPVRLLLPVGSARQLAESVLEYLADHEAKS